jgi:NADH dehydrogenase/NADH:ubiquinone oxidoreductase subunit G
VRLKKRGWMTLTILTIFLTTMLACGGGGGQYGDVKKTMESATKVMETLVKEMDQAEDGKAVASALNKFADELNALQPKMEELLKKHPELQNPENLPSEVREIVEKVETLEREKLTGVFMKATKYSSDPDVAKAMQKIQETMK